MKKILLMCCLVVFIAALLFACSIHSDPSVDLSKINADLTLGQALALLGSEHRDDRSAMYPVEYNWALNDRQTLYILFEDAHYDEFWEKFTGGAFELPEEEIKTTANGTPFMTDNEMRVLGEWYRSLKAVRAYIVENGEETILFDLKQ